MRIIITFLFLIINTNSFGQNEPKLFVVESAFGNIIYEGISNKINFKSIRKNEDTKLALSSLSSCKVTLDGDTYAISPDKGSQTAVVNILVKDSVIGFYIFNVLKLPLPKLMYTIPSEIDHLYLPDMISKKDLKYFQNIEAMVQDGFMSFFTYEIKKFEILIIKKNNTLIKLKNSIGNIEKKNFDVLKKLEIGDMFCFTNIVCLGNGLNETLINEGMITIKQ